MSIESMKTSRARRAGLATAAALTIAVVAAQPASAARSASASVEGDTLVVTTTNANERVALRLAPGAPGTLEVDLGDDRIADHSFDRAAFTRIRVDLRGGDDTFRIDQVNGAFADEALTVDGASGDDVLNGGDGAEVFYGSNGSDTIDGNRGADTAYMGNGRDTFIWDPGDGSDVVEGDNGVDTLDFRGAANDEIMNLTPNGHRSLFLRQPGNIRMDMGNVERLALTTLDGVDAVTIDDMTGTDLRRADIDLSGAAGGDDTKADVVTVNGSGRADRVRVRTSDGAVEVNGLAPDVRLRGSETTDQLHVNTLDGDDTAKVDGSVFAVVTPVVDLGPDES